MVEEHCTQLSRGTEEEKDRLILVWSSQKDNGHKSETIGYSPTKYHLSQLGPPHIDKLGQADFTIHKKI